MAPSPFSLSRFERNHDGLASESLASRLRRDRFKRCLEHSLLSCLTLAVDTNILIRRNADDVLAELFWLHETRMMNLQKTDTLDMERTHDEGNPVAWERLLESMDLIEGHGPMRRDYSRLDHAVFASPEEQARDDEIFRLIFGRERNASSRRNDVADAHHVSACVRYALDGFVTRDQRIHRAGPRLNVRHQLIHVVTVGRRPPAGPVECLLERARTLLVGFSSPAN